MPRVRRPDAGGVKINESAKQRTRKRIFAYSSETYELCMLPSGEFCGTPQDAFDAAAMCYLS
jgi:hypothetical protein